MKPTRGTMLAGLVLVAVAVPLTAYAVSGDDSSPTKDKAAAHAEKKADKRAEPKDATGDERAEESSAAGRAHAEAMKTWARCVAEAASGPKSDDAPIPPKLACGDKPMGPGKAKHAESGEAQPPGLQKPKNDRHPGSRR